MQPRSLPTQIGLRLGSLEPDVITPGRPTTLPFKIVRVLSGSSEAISILPSLTLTVDGHDVPAGLAFYGYELIEPQRQVGNGTLAFIVPRQALTSGIFDLYTGGSHLLAVSDKNGLGSDIIRFRSTESPEFWVITFGLIVVFATVGYMLFFRRRRYRLRTYPESLFQESSPTHSEPKENRPISLQPVAVPDGLVAALAEGAAALVIGPFLSAHAGVPVGTELLKRLLVQLGEAVPPALASADLVKLTDWSGGIDLAIETLLASVDRTRIIAALATIQKASPGRGSALDVLLGLPWRSVLSTTSDGLVERGLADRPNWTIMSLNDRRDIAVALRSAGTHFLVQLFGSFRQPTSLLLTFEELRKRLSQAPEAQRALALMLQTQRFCFVGVPPELLIELLQLLAPDQVSSGQRHYALLPNERADVWAAALSRFGVEVVRYDNYARGGFDDFIDPLAAALRKQGVCKVTPSRRLENLQVARLKLTNIGLFSNLDVSFTTGPTPGHETPPGVPWTVIFGPNGCGKSTVLRAVATALAGTRGEFAASRMLRAGQDRGAIELEMRGGSEPVTMQTLIYRDQSRVTVSCTTTSPVEAGVSLVLGFPSLRGAPSRNPEGVLATSSPSSEVDDVLPLAEGAVDHRMSNFKQFLVNTLVDASNPKNTRARSIKALLDELVREIVPGNLQSLVPITGAPYEIKANTPDGEVPFDELSQGMASVFNWIGVLLQRLYDVYPAEGELPPEKRHAVVLVDEIDAHLHPDWQRRLVSLTKVRFPHIQVIATAHSPLLAGSLHENETIVAKRDGESGAVTLAALAENLFGKSSQDILTGPAFRLSSDRNTVVEGKIGEYMELRASHRLLSGDQKKQLEQLESEIRPLEFAPTGLTPMTFTPPTSDEIAALQQMLHESQQQDTPLS